MPLGVVTVGRVALVVVVTDVSVVVVPVVVLLAAVTTPLPPGEVEGEGLVEVVVVVLVVVVAVLVVLVLVLVALASAVQARVGGTPSWQTWDTLVTTTGWLQQVAEPMYVPPNDCRTLTSRGQVHGRGRTCVGRSMDVEAQPLLQLKGTWSSQRVLLSESTETCAARPATWVAMPEDVPDCQPTL
mmetsp:Transcript_66265/g.193933  ORF Transcript_66265/g.193933 Transcript_66265/m.193933 type:complete len:185 (+) Transcript_66265:818-1372(+)